MAMHCGQEERWWYKEMHGKEGDERREREGNVDIYLAKTR